MPQMIGREEELFRLLHTLDDASSSNARTVLLSGEAGIGKTTLVQEFLRRCSVPSTVVLSSGASENAEPFQIFENALSGLGGKPIFDDNEYTAFNELFLIDNSGMLVAQATSKEKGLDADIFAGMFSAVQNFVQDSFDRGGKTGGSLGRLEYGDLKILVERGSCVSLVAVMDGIEHGDMRTLLHRTVKEIEETHLEKLSEWSGDMSEMASVQETIGGLTRSRFLVRKSLEGVSLTQERTRISEEVLERLGSLEATGTVLLLLEDLHWADESSLFVLNYLSRNLTGRKMMILGTLRPGEGKKVLDHLSGAIGEGKVSEVRLGKLDGGGIGALIEELYPNNRFDSEFREKLIGQCDGNPFFAKELLMQLEASGAIVLRGNEYHLEDREVALPRTIEETVVRRMDMLSADELAVVEYASCVGIGFGLPMLSTLVRVPDPAKVLVHLSEAGIVIDGDGGTYRFSHALIHKIIHDNLSVRWRRHYHREIGEHLECEHAGSLDEVVYDLARHFSHTHEYEKIFEYCRRAGEVAEGAFSTDLVIEFYKSALDASGRLRKGAVPATATINLLERLGEVQGLSGLFEDSLSTYARALELPAEPSMKARLHRKMANILTSCGQFSKAMEELELAEKTLEGGGREERGYLMIARSFINLNTGNFDDTLRLASEGIDVLKDAKETDAQKAVGRAWKILGACHMLKGNLDEALRCHEVGREIGVALNDPYGMAAAHNNLGNVHLSRNDYEKAFEHYNIAIGLMRKTKDMQGLYYTLNNIAIIHKARGEMEKALEMYEECLRSAERIGDLGGSVSIINNIGNLLREIGDDSGALVRYRRAHEIANRIGDRQMMCTNLSSMVPAHIKLGELDVAEKVNEEAYALAIELGLKRSEFWSIRNKGLLAFAKGDDEAARGAFRRAEEGFASIGHEGEVGETMMLRGDMLVKAGQVDEGRTVLKEALAIFNKLGLVASARECEGLIGR